MLLRMFVSLIFMLPLFGLACSSAQQKGAKDDVVKPVKQEGPECLKGCTLNSDGECLAYASAMDWSGHSEPEEIECDPRCCEGATTIDGSVDTDGDGIYDEADQCPDQPEDHDGFEDEDGCPDPDNDGDGIPDEDDLCPLDPEDFDGFEDEDGCPDP